MQAVFDPVCDSIPGTTVALVDPLHTTSVTVSPTRLSSLAVDKIFRPVGREAEVKLLPA